LTTESVVALFAIVMRAPTCLSIAGSDPSGGAGVQGDLKTFQALGAYGMAAITALTAQNGKGVQDVCPVEKAVVAAQLRSVLEAVPCDGIKIGMLGTAEIIRTVVESLSLAAGVPIVLDPVLVSTSGARLLDPGAIGVLMRHLVPLSTVITPNRAEAAEMLCRAINDEADLDNAARQLYEAGAANVLITGGDSPENEQIVDAWFDGKEVQFLRHARVDTAHTRGTGCALSAAICVGLAKGMSGIEAVINAREFVRKALSAAVPVGLGRGPVNHLT
jgi:hydroxymethylpyrimidine/phosphomethylpyrimidine kinase